MNVYDIMIGNVGDKMIVLDIDIVETVAWIFIILCFAWLSGSEQEQNEKSEDKRNDSDDKP